MFGRKENAKGKFSGARFAVTKVRIGFSESKNIPFSLL